MIGTQLYPPIGVFALLPGRASTVRTESPRNLNLRSTTDIDLRVHEVRWHAQYLDGIQMSSSLAGARPGISDTQRQYPAPPASCVFVAGSRFARSGSLMTHCRCPARHPVRLSNTARFYPVRRVMQPPEWGILASERWLMQPKPQPEFGDTSETARTDLCTPVASPSGPPGRRPQAVAVRQRGLEDGRYDTPALWPLGTVRGRWRR